MIDITKPSKDPFNLRIRIFATDKEGDIYQLALHTEEDIDSEKNAFMEYIDRIEKDEIIDTKVRKSLSEDFGLEKILQLTLEEFESGEEDFEGKFGDLSEFDTNERIINVRVAFDEDAEGKIGDLWGSWVKLS